MGTSLVAEWLRILLPMQATWVLSLVWEEHTRREGTKPECHKYLAHALEPEGSNY